MRPSRLTVVVCVGGLTKSTGPKELICFAMTDSRTLKICLTMLRLALKFREKHPLGVKAFSCLFDSQI